MLAALGDSLRDGRYLLERKLGQGGFGAVYEALDRELGIRIALKILRRTEPEAIARFKREFRALASLVHPHLVVLHELGFEALSAEQGAWIYTMERVDGAHFGASFAGATHGATASATRMDVEADRVTAAEADVPPISSARLRLRAIAPVADETLARLREIALALEFLHANAVLHCDIKPSNVLVHPARGSIVVDFGLATLLDAGGSASGSGGGTPGYMAPEQIERAPLGPAADVYALGAMMFEAISGRLPFEGSRESVIAATRRLEAPRLRALGLDVPSGLDALVAQMLERDPGLRPTAGDVADALAPPSSTPRRTPAVRQRPSSWPVVGRTDELARVLDFVRGARDALANMTIAGPSGIGKSTLVEAVKAELRDGAPALTLLEARCYERERSPVEVIDGIARSLLALAEQASAAPATAAPAAVIRDRLRLLAPLAPSVVAALTDTRAVAMGGYGRERALDALVDALRAAARLAPVVLLVEDLHWLDADGAACLARVLLDGDAPPMVLLSTARPGPSHGESLVDALRTSKPSRIDQRPRAFERVELEPLMESAAVEILRRAGSTDEIRSAEVIHAARGNPLLLRELALHVETAAGEERSRVEPTLASVIDRRVEAMPRAARTLLELAGIAGRPLAERILVQAVTRHGPAVATGDGAHALFTLISAGLLRREAPSAFVAPRHAALGAAAMEGRTEQERSALHVALAEALEANAPDVEAEAIARHFIAAGLAARAAGFVRVALDRALAAYAFERAAGLAQIGLGVTSARTERALLHEREGTALAALGRNRLAARAYANAARGLQPDAALDLERRAAEQLLRGGHVEEGLVALDRVLSHVGWRRPTTRVGALASLVVGRAKVRLLGARAPRSGGALDAARADAAWSMVSGVGFIDPLLAADFSARQFAAATRTGDPMRILRATTSEAVAACGPGEPARASVMRLLEQAQRSAERIGTPLAEATSLGARAIASATLGAFPEAFRLCSATEALYRDQVRDAPWDRVTLQHYLLWSAFEVGRFDVLSDLAPTFYAEATRRGDPYSAAGLAANYANLAWLLTDPPSAVAVVDACEAMWKGERFNLLSYDVALARANERLFHGDAKRALAFAERIYAELDRSLFLHFEALRVDAGWLVARARIAVAAASKGWIGRAEAWRAELSIAALERAPLRTARPLGRLARACLDCARGDRTRGARALASIAALLDVEGLGLYAALARRQAAELSGMRADLAAIDASLAERGVNDAAAVARIFLPGASA